MEKQRQLYDIDVVATWTPNDNTADLSLLLSTKDQFYQQQQQEQQSTQLSSSLSQQLVVLDRWKQWFLRRIAANISPLFLTTTVPSGIASTLTPLKSAWQISLSPDCQFLAVNHEDKIEFRTLNSSYQIVHAAWGATAKRHQDFYPKWRKIAWSADSRLVARSYSDGMIEIVDIKGRLIGTILPNDQQDASTGEELTTNSGSNQLFVEPLSYIGFTNVRKTVSSDNPTVKFNGNEYAYELITITYDGVLRSYLFNAPEAFDELDASMVSPSEDEPIRNNLQHRRSTLATHSLLSPRRTTWPREGFSDPGYFCFYHKFTFSPWFRTTMCASVDENNGIIIIGGAPHKSKKSPDDIEVTSGVIFCIMKAESPYYRKYKSDEQLDDSLVTTLSRTNQSPNMRKPSTGLVAAGLIVQRLFERDTNLCRNSVHTIIHHEIYGSLSLDCTGSLTSWLVSKEQGGCVKMTWDKDHLNYYARANEHAALSFDEFQKLVQEYHSNGTSSHLIGVVNGRCVSMRYWTKDAILLGYESGAMIVLQIPELINILGQEPRVFASCLEFTNSGLKMHDEQVFVVEEITRMIRARVIGDRWIMMTDQEDKALGEPTEEEIAQMMGNERLLFKWVAQLMKYFESKDVGEHRLKRQKLILVPKRTLSLYRILRVPPEELLYRKLDMKDYSSALAIATTYELNTDVIYQHQLRQLSLFNVEVVSTLLDKITDKQWVLAHCIDSPTEDQESIRTLLEYGLNLTETLMDDIIHRCELSKEVKIDWIRAAASGEAMDIKAKEALLAIQLTEKEVLWCKYRWYFLKYMSRLSTFVELTTAEKENRAQEEERISKLQRQKSQTHAPLDPFGLCDGPNDSKPPPLPLLTGQFNSFKDVDLAGQAQMYAESEFIEGVRILFTRHNRETWPWRLAILNRIPATYPVGLYLDLLPQIDAKAASEKPWTPDRPWKDLDWVEVPEFRTLVFGSSDHEMDAYLEQQALVLEERRAAHGGDEAASLDMALIKKEAEEILPSPQSSFASNETLSHWYIDRVLEIDRTAGQILEERRLIRYGIDHHIPGLESINEDLEILCKLIYEIKPDNRSPEAKAKWSDIVLDMSLEKFSLMNPMEVVKLCLSMTDEFTIVQDIRRLVLPFLTVVLPRRWQRNGPLHAPEQGLPEGQDSRNPMSYLYTYLLTQSPNHLPWVGAVIQESKPVYEPEERIISNDMELAWLTMSCMYGCRTVSDWKVMSDMIVCLPIFEQTEDVDEVVDKVRRAELRKDIFLPARGDDGYIQNNNSNDNNNSTSLPALALTPSRPRIAQQVDPLNMYPAFVKYAPTQGLMQHALDTLEKHLTAAEVLARYDLPVQLSWFLENSDSEANQLHMVIKMARLASGGPEKMGERFESDDEWMLLLEDLIRLRGGEKGDGVLGLVSEQDIYKEYLAGVLSCGKFELAKAILFPPGLLPPVRLAVAEKLVIDCSNEMYNNATSGNRHQGLMKMAYDCLKVLPETTNIRREMDLIEATNFMTSTYSLTAPGSSSVILPFQIRATEHRLSLVRRLIMTQENAYHDHEAMLELAIKVTGAGQKKSHRQQIEIQVVGMLIEAALKEHNHVFALQQSDRLMELLKISGSVDLNPDGSPRVRRVLKSNSASSFNSGHEDINIGHSGASGSLSTTSRPVSPSYSTSGSPSSQPSSRAGTGTITQKPLQSGYLDPDAKAPWETFVQVANESVGREYYKRLAVLGYAMACCPPEKIESILELWRSLEMESVHAPVPEVDPRKGIMTGFMSTVMDRAGSVSSGLSIASRDGGDGSTAASLGYGAGYNPGNATVHDTTSTVIPSIGHSGPLAEIMGRVSSSRTDSIHHQQKQQSMEIGRKRDKLKSLVSSIWAQ
ncbi:secretory pathway protein Sec39-domain-containing protein [Lobosporangium transversale]|uniref:Secretory pathway protein Sec39-domain-containing protein n=1 Tax=Lobosporangium transversale TaxID=64571 RepID=A0A1Y2GSU9_9FUNG|nr:secretory pathway protein Sec39-domain-containing protein [Lobosporangium transversale]ORZ21883.1 secretory pathway protein Sec39-domain-containing protein [Lobosporangium transversale]|eukprot:XP_021883134.1 secretory pathway protein Sec39-domain-containing protein [Lobosporangium transversale]